MTSLSSVLARPPQSPRAWSVSALFALALLTPVLFAPAVDSAELTGLVQDYRAKKQGLSKLTWISEQKVIRGEIAPILLKVGNLKTLSAYKFLETELRSERKELLPAISAALLATDRDDVIRLIVKKAYSVGGAEKDEVLHHISRLSRNLDSEEKLFLKVFRSEKSPRARRSLVNIFSKIDTLDSAKALLSGIREPRGKAEARAEIEALNDEIFQAIKVKRVPGVREWLSADAFKKVTRPQLLFLVRMAEAKNLVEARTTLVGLLDDRDSEVVKAACDTLRRIGLGDQVKALVGALRNAKFWHRQFQITALDTLASLNDREALEAVLEVARSGDIELRTLALGSLRHGTADPRSIKTLLSSLRHSKLEVRNAALISLSAYRDPQVVAALVKFIGTERVRRLRIEASVQLARTTQQDFGLEAEDWANWWEIVKNDFATVKKPKAKTMVRRPRYFGLEVSAENIAFVVDVSGSMREGLYGFQDVVGGDDDEQDGGRKIDILKKELTGIIKRLPESARINIVPFNQIVMPWKRRLQPLKSRGLERALKFVTKLVADGETNINDAIELALADEEVEAIYLLSDGLPTRGRLVVPEEILSNVQLLNRIRGVKIHCIGFGFDSHVLQVLARDSGGDYRMVRNWKSATDAPESGDAPTESQP